MPTFLLYPFVRPCSINSIRVSAQKRLRLTHRSRRALVVSLLLFALNAGSGLQAASRRAWLSAVTRAAISPSSLSGTDRKRLVMFRRNETPEGSRLTLTADSSLGDYKAFAEGERVCIMIPQAAFISRRRDESGRGFADMRIEQRDENVMLSFRLQPGASVAVNQNFNRLEVVFMTNERANSDKSR